MRKPYFRQTSRREFLQRSAHLGGALCLGATWLGCRMPAGEREERWQIGCYTRPWDQYDYLTALDGIAEAGFHYAGIMTAKVKTRLVLTMDSSLDEAGKAGEEVKQRGLKCLSLYAGEFPVAKSVEAGIEGLQKLIRICDACGSPNLMLAGVGDEKLYDAYFKVIAECCDYAAAKGIGLSIKPHGGFLANGAQCRKGVEKVGHKNFRIWYDPGNIFFYSGGNLDPAEDAAAVDGLVVGMSVKDFLRPNEVLITPGTGLVNFPGVLDRLKQGGFTHGPLLVECLKRGDPAIITSEARQARAFLVSLTGQKA